MKLRVLGLLGKGGGGLSCVVAGDRDMGGGMGYAVMCGIRRVGEVRAV